MCSKACFFRVVKNRDYVVKSKAPPPFSFPEHRMVIKKSRYEIMLSCEVPRSFDCLSKYTCTGSCGLKNRRSLVQFPARPMFFPRNDDSHCNRIHSSLTTFRCFDNGYVGNQPVAWKEYCAEYWLKQLQESMDKCTGHRHIIEILLKKALNTVQSINQSVNQSCTRNILLSWFVFWIQEK